MSDIISRLRSWVHAVDAAPASDLMDEAAAEIARLRDELSADKSGDRQFITLTDAEREAVELFSATAWTGLKWSEVERHAATLRGLLERMK